MKSSSGYEIYHNTLSSVLDEVEIYVQSKGYEVGDYFPEINHVSYGTTERTQLEMLKDGRIANTLAIQIYRLDSGKYELNCYPVRKFSKGDLIAKTMHEFKRGQLHSSSGDVVRNPKQAIAIGLSKERRGKFATGGKITFKKNTNNPNFITINIEYEIIKGSPMALGKQTMSGQMSQLSAKEAYKKGLEIGKKLELKYNIEDIEVTDLENGIVQVFAVSNDFVNLPISELQKFKDGGKIVGYEVKYEKQVSGERENDIKTFKTKEQAEKFAKENYGYVENVYEDQYKFATGGKVLWGTKVGEPDYNEQLITENENQIEAAKKWAEQNGFDRLRIQNLDLSTPPDFKKTFGKGGGIKSIKIGDKFHYKFDGKDYEVLGIENSKIVISPISSNSYWNNREISFSLMNKWIIEKTMRKI